MSLATLLIAVLLLGVPAVGGASERSAPAEDPGPSPERLLLSMGAGLGTALAPLAAGGAWTASSDSRLGRHGGIYLMAGGLALAPIVSHLVGGEYRRAGLFGIVPVLSAVGLRALLAAQPDLVEEGTTEGRVGLIVLLSLTVASSTVGLIDSLRARERAHAAEGRGAARRGRSLLPRGVP